MPADTELALDLAADYQDAANAGRSADLARICQARPDLIDRVRELLGDGGQLADAAARVAKAAPPEDAEEPMPDLLGRYELGHELGRGAFGVAYRGRDPHLNRDVAVKLLRAKWAGNGAVARRFLDEARITAQLQHPTIPAVHELGEHADGRPWMAMKLIKGRTLAELLHRGNQTLDRLAVFESVCQGMSYAHSKAVVHRDLKPENVMVGAFGEVQLMDWGLAKVLGAAAATAGSGDDTAGTLIQSNRESDGTKAGRAVGTPAYMSPEQAIGAVDRIDRRSDVFGLGAILCRMLTGQPPFIGGDGESTRQLAAMGKLQDAFARLDVSDADPYPELIALCKRCLAPEKADRPADAGELATAIATLRAAADDRRAAADGRVRAAELRRAAAEAESREQRKRRKTQVALLAAVIAGVVGTAVGLWEAEHQSADAKIARGLEEAEKGRRRAVEYEGVIRSALQLGRMRDTLAAFQLAADAGVELTPEMRLDRVRALAAVSPRERVQTELAAIHYERFPPQIRGRFKVWQAVTLWGQDDALADRLLGEAIVDGLPAAETEYVKGVRAATTPEAVEHFLLAIRHDWLHGPARANATFLLLFLGRLDEAARLADESSRLMPEHDNFRAMAVIAQSLRGDGEKAAAALEGMPAAAAALFRPLIPALVAAPEVLYEALGYRAASPAKKLAVVKALPLLGRIETGEQNNSIASLFGQLPPAHRDLMAAYFVACKRLMSLGKKAPDSLNAADEIARMDDVLRRHPEGFLAVISGLWLPRPTPSSTPEEFRERMLRIEDVYRRAAATPAIFPIQEASFDLALVAMVARTVTPTFDLLRFDPFRRSPPDSSDMARAIGLLRERIRRFGMPPAKICTPFAAIAIAGKQLGLARDLLDHLDTLVPSDPDGLRCRAWLEHVSESYPAAMRTAERALVQSPGNETLLRIRAASQARLRDLEVPPLPRSAQ